VAPPPSALVQILQETLSLLQETESESAEAQKHKSRVGRRCNLHEGDRVVANYLLEGNYYSAMVLRVSKDEQHVTVQYDDDGSEETLSTANVRHTVPPTATQTSLGGPLSDEEAFGSEHGDDTFLLPHFELQAELAALKEKTGDLEKASKLYEQAADGAMAEGKMQAATKWSLKAAELQM
jgi:Tudor domain